MNSASSYTSLVIRSQEGTVEYFDLQQASELSAMHPEMVLEFWRAGLVADAGTSKKDNQPVFDMRAVRRLRYIEDLRSHQDLKLRTLRLISHLVDRLESAEEELRQLRQRLA